MATAKHIINTDHEIQFEVGGKQRLIRTTKYIVQIAKEAIDIKLHHRNFNREAGFALSQT
jgi:hypothetical protein